VHIIRTAPRARLRLIIPALVMAIAALGLPYDTAYLSDFLHSFSGPIVLVGHSYGGLSSPTPPPATRRSKRLFT
jgi:hypothetical protein